MKKIIKTFISLTVATIVLCCINLINISALALDLDSKYKYEEIIIPKVFQDYELEDVDFCYNYSELYQYFSSKNTATSDEILPDYVLVSITSNGVGPMFVAEVFGNYVLENDYYEHPFAFGYGIYIPSTQEIYSLSYGYEVNIEGIENVFTEYGLGRLVGDMDKDRKITIKDATYIQKCLANISEFDNDEIWAYFYNTKAPLKYISDFNRDCNRNIKDATAIQKYLAKMEY